MYSLSGTTAYRFIAFTLFFLMCQWVIPAGAACGQFPIRGVGDPEEVASFRENIPRNTRILSNGVKTFSFLQPDTLAGGFEFPDEEEGQHLARDITIFVIVSAFVGYFIVKVFLEGEKEEPPEEKQGKDIPGSSVPSALNQR